MTIESVGTHEWTREWWDSLPTAYRRADAAEVIPPELLKVTLNSSPRLAPEFDHWNSSAPVQDADWVEYRLSRGFRHVDAGETVHFRVWMTSEITGGEARLELGGPGGHVPTVTVPMVVGDVDGHTQVTFFQDSTFTATLILRLPVDAGQDVGIRAIAVSHKYLDLEDLPTGEDRHYPLLRFMEGPGSIAGQARELSDDMWDGRLLDPRTAPDLALRFIAMLMGVPVAQRSDNPETMRAALVSLVENGRPPVGTRANAEDALRSLLTGEKQIYVRPTPGSPFVLSVLVRLDEVPDADVEAFEAKVMALGAIPAGHTISVLEASSVWDDWDLIETWDAKESAIKTWIDAQSWGVDL